MIKTQNLTRSAALALVLASPFAALPAVAQNTDGTTTGLDLNAGPTPVILQSSANLDVSDDTTQLLPALTGVRILGAPQQVSPGGTSASGVVVSTQHIPASVVAAASNYVGKPVTPMSLDQLTRDMVLAFRAHGLPVVNVVIPPQDVTNGALQVLAVVARLEDTIVTGSDDRAYYTKDFTLNRGDVLREAPVLDQLRWTSRRHNRSVEGIFSPGSSFGTTDLEFAVTETKPWSAFVGADTTGTDSAGSVGKYRLFAGVNYADLFTAGDEVSYQFTTSEEGPAALHAHVLSYVTEFPLIPRTDIQLSLAHIESTSTTIGSTEGTTNRASVKFHTQLPGKGTLTSDLRYGFDYKRTNNDLIFGGVTASTTTTELGLFSVEVQGVTSLGNGQLAFNAGIYGSPGGIFGNDNDTAYDALRAGADASFFYARGGFDYVLPIQNDWRLSVSVDAQASGNRLLPSEMFNIGGLDTVRGFDENVTRGDMGIVARFEAQAPSFTISEDHGIRIRPFAFFDHGSVKNNTPLALGESGTASLTGAGIGGRVDFGNSVSLETVFGANLDTSGVAAQSDSQISMRLIARF